MPIFNRVKEIVRTIVFAASPRLYGRSSSGAGDGEEISIGSGLTLTGGVLSATGATGPAGPNSVTSATSSDGTCQLHVDDLMLGDRTDNEGHTLSFRFAPVPYDGDFGGDVFFITIPPFAGGFYCVTENNLGIPDKLTNGTITGSTKLIGIGPYANDAAAAAAGLLVGSLYYTADGSVKRRMA